MAESKPKFPAPEDGDAEDVVLALETANALWGREDSREAIRWLRRAAEAAEEAGNDMRAVGLARTAADLSSQPDKAKEAAPAKSSASSQPSSPQATQPAATPTPPDKPAPQPASSPPPAAAPARKETPSAPPPSGPKSTPPPAPAAAPSSPGKESAIERIARRAGSEPSRAEARPTGDKTKDAMVHLAALASADATTGTPRAKRSLGPYQALRVSVEPSKDDRKLLLVRVLNQSEEPAADTYEAMLVSINPNVDVRSRKR